MRKAFHVVTCGSMEEEASSVPSDLEVATFQRRVRPYLPDKIELMLVSEDVRSLCLARTFRIKDETRCVVFFNRRLLADPSEETRRGIDAVFESLPSRSVIFSWPALLDAVGLPGARPSFVYEVVFEGRLREISCLVPAWMPAY